MPSDAKERKVREVADVATAMPRSFQVKRAHNAIRHLADYVLVWGGGQPLGKNIRHAGRRAPQNRDLIRSGRRDDLGKSPHLARQPKTSDC